jgi:hypothetical protein
MKNLIGAVLVLLMSAPVVADDVAVTAVTPAKGTHSGSAWVVVKNKIYYCYSNPLGDLEHDDAVTPVCWEAKKITK